MADTVAFQADQHPLLIFAGKQGGTQAFAAGAGEAGPDPDPPATTPWRGRGYGFRPRRAAAVMGG